MKHRCRVQVHSHLEQQERGLAQGAECIGVVKPKPIALNKQLQEHEHVADVHVGHSKALDSTNHLHQSLNVVSVKHIGSRHHEDDKRQEERKWGRIERLGDR